MDFAENYIKDSNGDNKAIIKRDRKPLLFNDQQTWIKKESEVFGVTMDAYNGAEVCELLLIFILYQLSLKHIKNNVGIYKDDGF